MREWEQRLVETGCRLTASRRAVMQVLMATVAPLSPREVLEQAQGVHPKLGLVSVYRTLNLMAEMGLVRRIHRQDGCHAYLLASPGHHHAVVCELCGRAAEFAGLDDLAPLIDRVGRQTGYRVNDHLLQLGGVCPECQQTRA